MEKVHIISGPIVHSEILGKITIIEAGFIAINNGKIVACGSNDQQESIQRTLHMSDADIIYLLPGQFLMPGLIDTHIHAPQYPNIGLGYDKPLLEWLETYTFPLEAKFSDHKLARSVYSSVVQRTLGNGTTTACYFATIHLESSLILADVVREAGQRALVGKVNMNQNHPLNYGETTSQSLSDTETFITTLLDKKCSLVLPVITPRFAVSCDMPLMTQLGKLALKYDVHIQTHVSESLGEIELVQGMYPKCTNYTDVYDKANLLTTKTVLAHGVHLKDEELEILSKRGTSVSHCPSSNTCLQSGLCNVRRTLSAGVKVGLGTDVSGGCSPSILDAMRCALTVSSHIGMVGKNKCKPLNFQEVFYLATLGGAQALALDDKIGNFAIGKDFDALIVTAKSPGSPIDLFGDLTTSELVQKFIYLGDDRNITQVFVAGNLVKNTNSTLFGNFRNKKVTMLSQ